MQQDSTCGKAKGESMTYSQSRMSGVYEFFRELPVTKIILAIWALNFLASLLGAGAVNAFLDYMPGKIPNGITGLFTYPLAMGINFFGLLFGGLMLWQFGGSLERSWTSRNYVLFLLSSSAAAALLWTLGVWLFTQNLAPAALSGPWMMIASVIVAWAWLNPEQTIMIWFILPVQAKWIAWATIAFLYLLMPLSVVGTSPLILVLGVFALGGVAVAYVWTWYQHNWAWIPRKAKPKPSARTLRHPSSTWGGAMLRPFREWQRRRRIAQLEKTFQWDDEPKQKP